MFLQKSSISLSGFEEFFDSNWLNISPYFKEHRTRFSQTWSYLDGLNLPRTGGLALEIGGVGPLGEYLRDTRQYNVLESKTDLRESLPFEDELFDLVICTETIEHIKDVNSQVIAELESFNYSGVHSMLTEIGRLLKPTGKLFITTPNANSYITLAKWLTGELPLMHAEHVREFSVEELRSVIKGAGLVVENISTFNSWTDNFLDELAKVRKLIKFCKYPSVERGDNIFAVVVKNQT